MLCSGCNVGASIKPYRVILAWNRLSTARWLA